MTRLALGNPVQDRCKFIGCEILYREACKLASQSPLRIDVEFLRKGLHDLERADMQSRLQAAVDAVPADEGYKAILLGYGRCNDGLVGLTARSIPLVIPRAHDCITFFFGSRETYQEYFEAHPGTYFHTTGWCERNNPDVPGTQGVMAKLGLDADYDQLIAKYGRENAEFILATLGDGLKNYCRICYIRMNATDEQMFIDTSRKEAQDRSWEFELRQGDWSLLERLFAGQWSDDDFLTVPPGRRIAPCNNGRVLELA
jgi:hypothetical protein